MLTWPQHLCSTATLLCLCAMGTGCAPLQRPEVLQFCAIDATTTRFLTSARIAEGSESRARPVEPSSSCRTLRKVVGARDEPRSPKLDQWVHVRMSAPGYLARQLHYRMRRNRNTVVVGLRRTYTLDTPSEEELQVKTFTSRTAPACPTDCDGCLRTASSLQLTDTCYTSYYNRWLGEDAAVDMGTDTTSDKPISAWPSARLPHCRYTKDQVHRCKKRK